MANSFGLNDRPSRTSTRGNATLYQGSIRVRLPVADLPARARVSRRRTVRDDPCRAGRPIDYGPPKARAFPEPEPQRKDRRRVRRMDQWRQESPGVQAASAVLA